MCSMGREDMSKLNRDFSLHPITEDLSVARKGSVIRWQLSAFRYCWMHGYARVLCAVLDNLRTYIAKALWTRFLERFKASLFFSGRKEQVTSISAYKSKRFLESDEAIVEAATYWRETDILSPTSLAHGHLVYYSPEDTVELLFRSVKTFISFAYVPRPRYCDFVALDVARQFLLATFDVNGWKVVRIHYLTQVLTTQPVSMHFLTNHSLELLEIDKTAYYCVNEAMEAENKVVASKHNNGKRGEEYAINLRLLLSEQQERLEKISAERALYSSEKPNPPPLDIIIPGAKAASWTGRFRDRK